MKWTEAQQIAIDLRNKNILVSAAAGSGKTAVLVERIKRMILEDAPAERISVGEMLIVTFSNAAASEMREKIVKALTNEIEMTPHDEKEKGAYLRRQLYLTSSANISTFHAFCIEVIRRYFYAIDADPAFKICDDAQKSIMQSEALEEMFEALFDNRDKAFLDLLDNYAGNKNEDDVKKMILDTHQFMMSMPDPFEWLRESVELLKMDEESFNESNAFIVMKTSILEKLSRVAEIIKGVVAMVAGFDSIESKAVADFERVLEVRNYIAGQLEEIGFDELKSKIEKISFSTFLPSKAEKEDYSLIKEDVRVVRDQAKKIIKQGIIDSYFRLSAGEQIDRIRATYDSSQTLKSLVKEFDDRYTDKKRSKGMLDFNDLEHEALKALSIEEISNEYRNKFKAIFIDEYQDSNYVQEALINRVKKNNNVFMVGDVKQSIYKFRLAEPELFIRKYNAYRDSDGYSEKVDLNMNFRSKGNIVNVVNEVFSKLMTRPVTGIDYDSNVALYKGVDYEGELNYPVSLHIVDEYYDSEAEIEEEIKDLKATEIEAAVVAKQAAARIGTLIYDFKTGKVRKTTSRDIVILLRAAKSKADVFAEALKKEGIQSYVDSGDGYFETTEVEVFLNLLRIIDNKKQDIPLISVLYSPIFAFTANELAEIRTALPGKAFYEAFNNAATTNIKCENVNRRLEEWRIKANYMSMEDLIWMLIRETGYMDYVSSLAGSIQRRANLRALIDKAIAFQGSKMKGLFAFINYIELIKKNKVASPPVKLIGENDDVVRIMTIHKSKGLEFPIVIVACLGQKFNKTGTGGNISFHNEIGLALRYRKSKEGYYAKTLLQTIIDDKKRVGDIAEELRVLYVAFTRPMDELILSGSIKNLEKSLKKYSLFEGTDIVSGNNYLDWLMPLMPDTSIDVFKHDRIGISAENAYEEERSNDLEIIMKEALEKEYNNENEIERRLSFSYMFPEDVVSKSKFSVSEINRNKTIEEAKRKQEQLVYENATGIVPDFLVGKKKLSPAEIGTAVHKVMEKVRFDSGIEEKEINELIAEMVSKRILTDEEASAVDPNKIIDFLISDIGNRASVAASKGLLKREIPFTLRKDNVLIQGMIDCYFEEDDRIVLVDYKTNYIPQGDESAAIRYLRTEYSVQTALYKEALEKITGKQVEEAYLYSFFSNAFIRM